MISFRKKLAALSLAAAIVPAFTVDALAADATANASADVIQAIAVTKDADLGFGSIVSDATNADTVDIATTGTRTCGVNLTCTGATTAAAFTVAGAASQAFAVTLPANATLSSGGNSMTVDGFVDDAGTNLDGSGAAAFAVGATLNVGANQVAGNYTGTFDVTVDYN